MSNYELSDEMKLWLLRNNPVINILGGLLEKLGVFEWSIWKSGHKTNSTGVK